MEVDTEGPKAVAEEGEEEDEDLHSGDPVGEERPVILQVFQLLLDRLSRCHRPLQRPPTHNNTLITSHTLIDAKTNQHITGRTKCHPIG